MKEPVKSIRHRGCIPCVEQEGFFLKPLPVEVSTKKGGGSWHRGLTPFQRLHSHHTLASVRRYAGFVQKYVPKDDLDFVLTSHYDHNKEIFATKVDIILQPETVGIPTWRRLRNYRELKPERPVPLGHPLFIGGVKERIHPYSVKLMNSSHHSPQTNAGYVRNGQGGNYFYY